MKKFTKISATLLSVSMLMSSLPSAYALTITDESFNEATKTASVTVKNSSEKDDADVCLVVAATDETTNEMVAIDKSEAKVSKKGGESILSKLLSYTPLSGHTYSHNYYVWDNILNHTPLRNTAPTNVKNAVGEAKTNSVDITWDECLDDKGIKNYILRVDGNNVATSKTNSCSLLGLERNKSYECEIVACDEEGLESKTPAVVKASTFNMEECILSENDNPYFSFYDNHTSNSIDSYTEADFVAGRDCFKNTTQDLGDKKKVCFFYFPVSATYISGDMRDVAIEVTYYDDAGSSAPSIQYNSADGQSGKNISLASKTNTNAWKTVYAQIDDAKFTNPEELTYSAFRISAPSGTRVYKVALCPGKNYAPDVPNVKFSYTTDIYDMYFYPDDAQEVYDMSYNTISGESCLYAPKGGNFEFDIKDSLAEKAGGYIEVTYFDQGTDSLVLDYNNSKGLKKEVKFTDTCEFKTVQIPLQNAEFKNGIAGAKGKKFDFTLSTKNGTPLALTSVKYVPGGDEPDPEVEPEEPEHDPETADEIYALVNVTGKKVLGSLILKSWADDPGEDNTNTGYDHNILLSGKTGKGEQDGYHYMYNALYGDSSSWRLYKNAFYFNVPETFMDGAINEDVEIEAECYMPSGQLQIEFPGGKTKTNAVTPNKWTTTTFKISPSEALSFSNGFDGADFRFYAGSCQGYIHKVTVRKGDAIKTTPVNPPAVKTEAYAEVNSDGTALTGDITLTSWANYNSTVEGYDHNILFSGTAGRSAQDGKHYLYNQEFTNYGSSSWKRWANAFYFNVPDSFLSGSDYTKVQIEIECYAPESCGLKIVGKNSSGSDKSTSEQTVGNSWTTKTFEFTPGDSNDFVFSNGFSGCDFRLQFGKQGYVHKITVRKVGD